jgi:hypothetical protein
MKDPLPLKLFLPTLLAIAGAAWLSVPVIDHPLGSDWGHYFSAAEYLWDPIDGLAYPDFRKPWFGWLLGGLGQSLGYLKAAQLISKLALMVTVGAAALLTAALANRLAGLVAAASVLLMPLAMDGALWVNHYPLLGAAVGLAFASAAAAVRWRQLTWVVLAGAAAGASFALDLRGSVAVPVAGALVLLGSWSARSAFSRLIVFGVVLGGIMAHAQWLEVAFDVPQLPIEQQLMVQRAGTLEQARRGLVGGEAVQVACGALAVRPFDISTAWSACGVALRQASFERLATTQLIPQFGFMGFLFLCLVPTRERWRSMLTSAMVFGAPMLSVAVGMAWVTYFDRYLLPFAVVLSAMVPVGVDRVLGAVSARSGALSRFSAPLGAVIASALALYVWPGWSARSLDAPEAVQSSEYHAGVLAAWARADVAQGDGIIDCAGLAIDSLLLPDRLDYVRFPPGDLACVERVRWPKNRSGITYLITMHRDLPTSAKMTDLPFNVGAVAALGWAPVEGGPELDGYRLWRRQ